MASKKPVKTSPATVGLAAIVAATVAGSFSYTSVAEHEQLVVDGLVEVNPEMKDETGALATRATAKGIAQVGVKTNPTGVTAVATSKFSLEDNVAIPAIVGRGRTGSAYPFDEMKVGQSFFVDKDAKTLASTVSSANARYAEVIPGETRTNRKNEEVPKTRLTKQFIVRSVNENGKVGSRIWRKA